MKRKRLITVIRHCQLIVGDHPGRYTNMNWTPVRWSPNQRIGRLLCAYLLFESCSSVLIYTLLEGY